MTSRILALFLATAALAVSACGGDDESTDTTNTTPTATATTESNSTSSSGTANTAEVVKAAQAWLATLTDEQRELASYDFDDTSAKATWSNLPVGNPPRNGVAFEDMSDEATKAAQALAKAVLSDTGYEEFEGIRKADDYLTTLGGQGGGGGGGGYGAGLYYVAIFGTPSEDEPFMVAFSGHHMAYNITYDGDSVSSSPSFTGVEPPTFETDGATIAPLQDEADAIFALMAELPDDARFDASFDDILLGPGEDGNFPDEPEAGVKVTDLDAATQKKVTAVITAYAGDVDESVSEGLIAGYKDAYADTYVAYSGGTTKDSADAYLRIDGPGVWIEFSNQAGVVTDNIHYHSIYRDQNNDYGES